MPRAGVHATRDLPTVRRLLAQAGLRGPTDLPRLLRQRHRDIDSNQEEEDTDLHFMRGDRAEPQEQARREALGHVQERVRRAAEALAAAMAAPAREEPVIQAVRAFTDAAHAVRDSFSTGHAIRHPGPGGPRVEALRSWDLQNEVREGFGLKHALLHDLRFEWPFRAFAPEVPASDRAVEDLARLVGKLARGQDMGEKEVEALWEDFRARHFRRR